MSPARCCSLIAPLEFISNIIVRPITLALRLFANMFAGHLLLLLFALGGEYLLLDAGNVGVHSRSASSSLHPRVRHELPGDPGPVLQAYVFTLLTAMYISGALAEEH